MRCYFHLIKGDETISDHCGIDLPNLEEAHILTVEAITDIRAKQPILAAEGTGWMLTVADCTGAVLFTVSLDSRLAS
jgi:hypothetical protein